ncbi:hypothetical protein VNO80_29800 [Phaseolus coccineus]|uniref:Secreted protein n=1 Tax=Phaseolus coccineus TaxID=3886 RepID=A0AAN9LBL7_PHACN
MYVLMLFSCLFHSMNAFFWHQVKGDFTACFHVTSEKAVSKKDHKKFLSSFCIVRSHEVNPIWIVMIPS